MAYQLKRNEQVTRGLRRIARQQVQQSLDVLTSAVAPQHESIHGVRKRLKKLRALVRLIQDELGECYDQENAAFRDVARELATARDAEVMVQACGVLMESLPEPVPDLNLAALRDILVARRQQVVRQSLPERIESAVGALRMALERIDQWPLTHRGFAALAPGVLRVYRQGRKALRTVAAIPSAIHLHEWRKLVKYHWHHTRLLQGVWPAAMSARQGELEKLSDLLGNDHDLFVLLETVETHSDEFQPVGKAIVLAQLIEGKRRNLQKQASRLGRLLYAERPKAFTRRLEGYWRIWKRGKPASKQARSASA